MQWTGHVQRLPVNHIPIKAVKAEFTGSIPVGRPSFKWQEGVQDVLPDFCGVTTGS